MDNLKEFKKQVTNRLFLAIFIPVVLTISAGLIAGLLDLSILFLSLTLIIVGLLSTIILTILSSRALTSPVQKIEEIISYATHSNRDSSAPDIDSLKVARELVSAISLQIYDMTSSAPTTITVAQQVTPTTDSSLLLNLIAIPIIGIDSAQKITVVNRAAAEYIGKPESEIAGKQLYDLLQLAFQNEDTLENWLSTTTKSAVTLTRKWTKVRNSPQEGEVKQFDLVASFSSGNQSGAETMLAFFDRTESYNNEDQQVDFVALAVHELRTPLTIMRGYIEVFEDELGPGLSPELAQFMHKMHASAQQLTAFVGNILNVARIEENQLALKLRSESWPEILKMATEDLQMRAHVHGIQIELQIAEGLPPVAVDRISIHEVLNNLVDNAIKYSEQSNKIVIQSQINTDGLVETSVQDFGIGMPTNVVNDLFQKYYRSHKTNVQVGGTGLGLYISKALVNAHGGNIWVRSKEGEGSIFSFTILPYDKLSAEQKEGEDGIIRGAHGWIKNHSLYRQ